jgi:arylsulfatase A-like enzyme
MLPLVLFGIVQLAEEVAVSPKARRNVLLIVVDDLRPEIGAYGNHTIQTPNIDSLAQGGMRFDRAFVQQATCLVSRASLFSGLRPDSMRLDRIDLERLREKLPGHVLLPKFFREHGYFTASFG